MSASRTKSRRVAPWIAGSAGSICALLFGTGGEAGAEAVVTPKALGALTLPVWHGRLAAAADKGFPCIPERLDGELVVVTASRGSAGTSVGPSQQFVMHRNGLSWPLMALMALMPRT